jgi:hypothetical protein
MKPYGREHNLKGSGPWKKDHHPRPKKLWINWWEDIVDLLPRTTIKHNVKKEIDRDRERDV